jgi:hypothetical protein
MRPADKPDSIAQELHPELLSPSDRRTVLALSIAEVLEWQSEPDDSKLKLWCIDPQIARASKALERLIARVKGPLWNELQEALEDYDEAVLTLLQLRAEESSGEWETITLTEPLPPELDKFRVD